MGKMLARVGIPFLSLVGGQFACAAPANRIDWNVVEGGETAGVVSINSYNIAAAPCGARNGVGY